MNNTTKSHDFYAARVMMVGMSMGMVCMAALFIAGLITGSAGMTVMAATTAVLLAAVWSSTVAAAKKKAAVDNSAA